ncbi:phosphate ABC transporter permease PstA [Halolamina litorea]|uniref:Phosphate transport system permease protein PstA n=1 Tax=Halolamina litorea TaxID=1515593 RepID=A0ABD6BRR1_9EURY|nr:phosphate ABC transporter permease PstA [Halolamina litorea]
MSTETTDGFGHVSRRVGQLFRYVLFASTLVGILTLAVLLVYVANDAFRPLTADPGWHLVFFLTLVVPTVGVGWWSYRRSYRTLTTGLLGLVLPGIAALYAGGLAALFIDVIPTLVWLSFVVALAVPGAVVVALSRTNRDVPFLAQIAAVLVSAVGSLLVIPGLIQSFPTVPADWMVLVLTIGVPEGALLARWADGRWGRRDGLIAGVGTVIGSALAGVAGIATGIGAVPGVALALFAGVPTAIYVAVVVSERPEQRIGLLLPATIIVGALVGELVVGTLGFAGPESWVDWGFLTGTTQSGDPRSVGIYSGVVGTILLMFTVAAIAIPTGVGAAVYLEEYAPDTRLTRIIDVNISNLAGVPSVVYGLLGLGLFVRYAGAKTGTLIVGGATLALLVFPIVIISSREAIRAVPDSARQASYGMGATRWQTVKNVVLPRAFPGILTGTILALSRAIGETAPLLVIGAAQVFGVPDAWDSTIGAMPLQLYVWASTYASPEFYTTVLAAGIVVLLTAMLSMNSIAIYVRNHYEQR